MFCRYCGSHIPDDSLFCAKCNETYPIEDSIPNLLPPDLRKATSGAP